MQNTSSILAFFCLKTFVLSFFLLFPFTTCYALVLPSFASTEFVLLLLRKPTTLLAVFYSSPPTSLKLNHKTAFQQNIPKPTDASWEKTSLLPELNLPPSTQIKKKNYIKNKTFLGLLGFSLLHQKTNQPLSFQTSFLPTKPKKTPKLQRESWLWVPNGDLAVGSIFPFTKPGFLRCLVLYF